MSSLSEISKKHIVDICNALKSNLKGESIETYNELTKETTKYILDLYPDIKAVRSKYENNKLDMNSDIEVTLENKCKIKLNIFRLKGRSAIQPKNLGAKSFLKKYFLAENLQSEFNEFFTKEYKYYLQSILNIKGYKNVYDNEKELRKKVSYYYPRFENEINFSRKTFLFNIREFCFELLKEEFNEDKSGIHNAFNKLMLIDSTNIISRYTEGNKCLCVEEWKSTVNVVDQKLYIYKKGNDQIGIRFGVEALTIRFKFESGPSSSIKLATSYEKFPVEEGVINKNLWSIKLFETIIDEHNQVNKKDDSNAVGKCNEALIYYRLIENNSKIHQVDEEEYRMLLETYSPYVSSKTLLNIKRSSIKAVEKIVEYLSIKYKNYIIDAIQLVPDSYLEDRLDTSDLKVILRVSEQYVEEKISIKAISKSNAKITVKNPGAGTILGPMYFNIGSLKNVTDQVRDKFNQDQLNHYQSLELISEELGVLLKKASQENLKQGLAAIRGTATTLITNYNKDKSVILEHDVVRGEVEVFPKKPTNIQTTLRWNYNQEELSLRIKFGSGKQHGWSSVKLACEYKIEV